MERRIWLWTSFAPAETYANLFVFLVGPPGGGKTVALKSAEMFLRELDEIKIAPDNISAASLNDALNESKRKVVNLNAAYMEFNSMLVHASELSSLIPVYDHIIMGNLTKLFDNESFTEWKRGGGLRIIIPKPQINLVGGCTPEYLNNWLPEGAWGQGFMSRVIMIFSDEEITKVLFNGSALKDKDKPEYQILTADLKSIFDCCGEMKVAKEVVDLLQAWENARRPPIPEHFKLVNYNTRRITHLIKLCMISSLSRSNSLLIEVEDYQTALGWLLEAEAFMPEIFKAMGTGGTDAQAIQEAWQYIYQNHVRGGKPTAEHQLVHFLQNRTSAHSVGRIIELLVKSNMTTRSNNEVGQAQYTPTPKHLHAGGL